MKKREKCKGFNPFKITFGFVKPDSANEKYQRQRYDKGERHLPNPPNQISPQKGQFVVLYRHQGDERIGNRFQPGGKQNIESGDDVDKIDEPDHGGRNPDPFPEGSKDTSKGCRKFIGGNRLSIPSHGQDQHHIEKDWNGWQTEKIGHPMIEESAFRIGLLCHIKKEKNLINPDQDEIERACMIKRAFGNGGSLACEQTQKKEDNERGNTGQPRYQGGVFRGRAEIENQFLHVAMFRAKRFECRFYGVRFW